MGLLYSKPLEIFNLDWSTEWSPTPKPCPLFRLPFFALLEVFKSLDPIELFILSQCSKKVANCVHIVGSKKWKLTVYVGSKCIKINNKYRLFIIETTQKSSWRYDKKLGYLVLRISKHWKQETGTPRCHFSNLMKLKSCKCLKLSLSLTMHDLDVFMKEWKTGGFPNLQYMLIVRNRVRSTGQILGFGKFNLSRRGVRRRLVVDENLSVDCTGGRDIKADNGTKATMQMERVFSDSFELKPLEAAFGSLNLFFNLDWSTEWSPTPKNLPLLRLSLLPLVEVFKSLDPIELFILAQCSRKAASCIHIVGSKKWRLSVDAGHKIITINNEYMLTIDETSRKPFWKYERELRTFFLEYQNSKLEFQDVLSQVQDVFRCPVTSFEYKDWWNRDQCWFLILKHTSQNQTKPLESFYLSGTFKNEDLEWALQNVKVSQKIGVHLFAMHNFTTDFRPECEQLTIISYYPIRLDLMKFKACKYLKLCTLSLTMHDLDVFIKEWKAGSFPNLQYMLVESNQFNWIDSILGFRRTEMSQLGERKRLVIDEYLSVECNGGVDIQADNGTKATMHMNGGPPDCDFQPKCERLDLMTLNSCKYIEVTLSSVTIHGLNVFMKEWKTGSYPNLQYLLIRTCYLSWVDKILGFDRDELKQLGLRRRLVIDEKRSIDCTGGVDIQADNEIFKSLDPIELFILSQCSKRVANSVHYSGTTKWKLSVDTRRKLIEINNHHKLFITESSKKPTWEYDRNLKTCSLGYQKSENSKQELRKVLSQLQAAFRCPVTSFTYTDWSDNGQCWVSVLKHIVQHQLQPLESIDIAGTFNHEDFDWALQNVKVTQKIGIRIYTARFFRPDLMMFKLCQCIELYYSWLKINDLDVFMKGWKAGSLPNLQYMKIGSDLFHSDDSILGFKREEMKQLGVRRRLKIDEKKSVECTGGVDIEADNGTKATMQIKRGSPEWFQLFVWNN
ncbi:unnamed protein product [Caenorhabditis brenneri]